MNVSFIPVIRRDCTINRISNTRFRVFINEKEEYIELDKIKADLLSKILPLLEGKYSLAEVIKRVSKKDKIKDCPKIIKQIIANLLKWGLISKYNKGVYLEEPQTLYLSSYTSYPLKMQRKLHKSCIAIAGAKYVAPILINSLTKSGVKHFKLIGNRLISKDEFSFFNTFDLPNSGWHKALTREFAKAQIDIQILDEPYSNVIKWRKFLKNVDIVIIITPGIADQNFQSVNKLCLDSKIPLLFGSFCFAKGIIGPLVIPFQSACLKCRELRLQENYYNNDDHIALNNNLTEKCVNLNSFIMSYAHLVAGFVCTYIIGLSKLLINREITIDFNKFQTTSEYILKLPRCPVCGSKKLRDIKDYKPIGK